MQKWITKHKDAGQTGWVCHFEGALDNDYTLCGQDTSGDSDIYEEPPKMAVYGKVNCPSCKAIVAAVRKIKGNEIEKD